MCCCAKPNTNGEPGYSWDGENISVRTVDPPALTERDVLLFDEPGRCGGMDSHCHHYRLVKEGPWISLLVRHGGGDERIHLSLPRGADIESMDSDTRYWLLNAIYHAYSDGRRSGSESATKTHRQAFADGRLKKRKMPKSNSVKVWIEQPEVR